MNKVIIHPHVNKVKLEPIHVESHYQFLTPVHVVDTPKERE